MKGEKMRYCHNKWGYFLGITKENSGEFYNIMAGLGSNNKKDKALIDNFIFFLSSTPYFSITTGSDIHIWSNRKGYDLPEYNIFVTDPSHKQKFDANTATDIIAEFMEDATAQEIEPESFYELFRTFLGQRNKLTHSLFIDEKKDVKKHLDKKLNDLAGKKGVIYKVPFGDIMNLSAYIDYYFVQGGEYYVMAHPGVLLDDFYKRADIKEIRTRRIPLPKEAVQK